MFVGEGRVGKTALCRAMMGKPFEKTASTVGFTRKICEVSTDNRGWLVHDRAPVHDGGSDIISV